jgi:predicted house-cleaning noncanonical NTP pyrophosphatase (MazG superfamily)
MEHNGDIAYLQNEVVKWADEVLPNRTVHQALTKLVLEEIPEFLIDTTSATEYADLIILILDIAHLQGIDIKKAVLDKMRMNKKRKWSINPETGIAQHVKSEIILHPKGDDPDEN